MDGGHERVEGNELEKILLGRRITAEAYLQAAAHYNLELSKLGEEIPLLELGDQREETRMRTIRTQLRDLLRGNGKEHGPWDWGAIESPSPENNAGRRRLLKDMLGDVAINPEDARGAGVDWQQEWAKEWDSLGQKPAGDKDMENWAGALLRKAAGWPLPKALEESARSLNQKLRGADLWDQVVAAAEEARVWSQTTQTTPPRRLAAIRAQGGRWEDFDPNLPKWQEFFLECLKKEGISLEEKQESPKLANAEHADLWIVGEKHGSPGNFGKLEKILEKGRELGFETLTLEEPEDTSWKPWAEFASSLGAGKKYTGKELLAKAQGFCLERLLENRGGRIDPSQGNGQQHGTARIEKAAASLGEKMAIIHRGRALGYRIVFTDIPAAEKAKRAQERRERSIKAIIDAPPTRLKDPISALGGAQTWAASIKEVYADCKDRSLKMAERIGKEGKAIHIGGLLHCLDIGRATQKMGRRAAVWWLEEAGASPVIAALGQEPPKARIAKLPKEHREKGEMEL